MPVRQTKVTRRKELKNYAVVRGRFHSSGFNDISVGSIKILEVEIMMFVPDFDISLRFGSRVFF